MKALLIIINILFPYAGCYINGKVGFPVIIAVFVFGLVFSPLDEDVIHGEVYVKYILYIFAIIYVLMIIHSIYILGKSEYRFRDRYIHVLVFFLIWISLIVIGIRDHYYVLAAGSLEPYRAGSILIPESGTLAVGEMIIAWDRIRADRLHFGVLGGLPGWKISRDHDGVYQSCDKAGQCVGFEAMCITAADDMETYELGPEDALIFKRRNVGIIAAHIQKVENIQRVGKYFDAIEILEFAKPVVDGCTGMAVN